VVEDAHVLEEALKLAEELSHRALYSFAWSKKLLTDSFSNSLETHLELERAALRACAAHPDGREGVSAFLEKRTPTFDR
jgi:2-(1,2-epoxy-1,2-dihydrophenyl)acetyl-CoA isomerase